MRERKFQTHSFSHFFLVFSPYIFFILFFPISKFFSLSKTEQRKRLEEKQEKKATKKGRGKETRK